MATDYRKLCVELFGTDNVEELKEYYDEATLNRATNILFTKKFIYLIE